MKRWLLPVLAFSIMTLFSCKKLQKLTQFDLTYNSEATISAGIAASLPFDVFTPDITTQSESAFNGHHTSSNLIESVKLKQMKLSVTSPEGRSFDFLKDIEIYISADGEEEIMVAAKHNIPETVGSELLLDPADAELKPYLIKDKYKIRLKVTTDKIVNEDVKLNIGSTFHVDANILGL